MKMKKLIQLFFRKDLKKELEVLEKQVVKLKEYQDTDKKLLKAYQEVGILHEKHLNLLKKQVEDILNPSQEEFVDLKPNVVDGLCIDGFEETESYGQLSQDFKGVNELTI